MICVFMICLIICLFIGQMCHENVYIIMIIFYLRFTALYSFISSATKIIMALN